MTLHVALYEPEIPPNTGNIIRLCANSGAKLHIIEPAAFDFEDKKLRRAGLDYHEFANIQFYKSYLEFTDKMESRRVFACSTHGTESYSDTRFKDEDVLLMGPETRGLPETVRLGLPEKQVIRIPMVQNSRSLNLSNATAIILYEAWRQVGFQV
jgi:tRNA (cytidine/uridine-2'-O-)-methyltransferase